MEGDRSLFFVALLCCRSPRVLSEYLAVLVDHGIRRLQLPAALGGILIAVLVLSPGGLTAFQPRSPIICTGGECMPRLGAGDDWAHYIPRY
jgi:hypothetical protein